MAEWNPRVNELFLQAIQLTAAAERQAFLDSACGNDAELRLAVDTLMKAHDQVGSFLESPHVPMDSTIDQRTEEKPGTQIGPYKLLQQIGEGGMGVVFMAEQTQPVHRKVALKIIKPGMDSKQVIARFEAERQALAMMDHINIARVIEGGATESGRPYFVMELINGVPITKYCDDNHLTPRERLELFIPVCQAVQHAHQKGIIHRDIKPSNVLVTLYDGKPVPKVIDFGIAKATEQKLTERTLFTNFGTMVGTLEYMSPEQVEMSALGVDTRSDIYSLGVLLYELLTGSTPLSRKQLKEVAYLEILRLIKEEEPPRPSNRLSNSGAALASISAQRKTEPTKLSKLMRGELDWIVMKTLEKDRNRRYETANGFAADIQRYLLNEPVQACPPSTMYRMRKFVVRHRGPVLAASLILLAMVGGIIGTTLGLFEARSASVAERKAKEAAESRESETLAVLDFIEKKVFGAAKPQGLAGGLGYDVTLRKAVEAALPFVDEGFADKPLIEARLRLRIGDMFDAVGNVNTALEQHKMALALYLKHSGSEHPDTLKTKTRVGGHYFDLGQYQEALQLHEEIFQVRKARFGPYHRDTLGCMNNIAICYDRLGRKLDALKLHEETLALKQTHLGADDLDVLPSMQNLASCYTYAGRHADALKLLEELQAIQKDKLEPDHPGRLLIMHNLANCYNGAERYEDARKLMEEIMPLIKKKFGPDHPYTIGCLSDVAKSYGNCGRHAEGIKLHEESLTLTKAKLGSKHRLTLSNMKSLVYLLADCPDIKLRNIGRAIELGKECIELEPGEGEHWQNLGIAQYRAGDWKAAVSTLEKSIKLSQGGDSFTFFFLAMASCQLGNMQEARKWYDQAIQWMEKNTTNKLVNEVLRRKRAEAATLLKIKEDIPSKE